MSGVAVFAVTLTVRSPFMFHGLANSRLGVDSAVLRNESGDPIIPADQVRGVLSAACFTLAVKKVAIAPLDVVKRLFGDESVTGSFDEPNRGLLIVSDLRAARDPQEGTTTRIEIDDETGATKSGALQVVELAAPFGRDVTFRGEIHLRADRVDVAAVTTLLDRALKLAPAIGAFKSAGYGEIVEAKVALQSFEPVSLVSATTSGSRRRAYRVTFDRPILVDATRETENLFVGSTIIPGAALKGALAEKLRLAGKNPETDAVWSAALEKLRISHGFPENDAHVASGFALPASLLAWQDDDGIYFSDALLTPPLEYGEIPGALRGLIAPLFPHDWKEKFFNEFKGQGILTKASEIAPLPRTHVKIAPDQLIAEDGALFTTVAQGVLCKDGAPRAWRIIVDDENVPEPQRGSLAALLEGDLFGVGRTGAKATIERSVEETAFDRIRSDAPPKAEALPGHDNFYAMTLITPALLSDTRSDRPLDAQYKQLIEAQTGGKLLRAFTRRRLAGGYVGMRRRPYGKKTFYPFVLTEPGSVFLVESGNSGKLADVANFGLAPTTLTDADALTWRNCPYLRENGYGEVVFSLIDHVGLAGEANG